MRSSSEPRRREDRALRSALLVVLLLMPLTRRSQANPGDATSSTAPTHRLHLELDPQPFALGGHGVQVGWRPAWLPGLRIALANFALDIPDAIAQLGDNNDGFHLRVRPTPALFVHTIYRGFLFGGSLRYLRLEYTHDDVAGGVATTEDISLEAICGYHKVKKALKKALKKRKHNAVESSDSDCSLDST